MPDEFMPQGIPLPAPTAVVIFGASGDLTQRKLIPALYTLFAEQHLPEQFAVIGDASLFARADEIERSWQITDPIQAGWNQEVAPANGWRAEIALPLEFYEQGTWGPPAADRLLAQAGRHWRLGCSNKHR